MYAYLHTNRPIKCILLLWLLLLLCTYFIIWYIYVYIYIGSHRSIKQSLSSSPPLPPTNNQPTVIRKSTDHALCIWIFTFLGFKTGWVVIGGYLVRTGKKTGNANTALLRVLPSNNRYTQRRVFVLLLLKLLYSIETVPEL